MSLSFLPGRRDLGESPQPLYHEDYDLLYVAAGRSGSLAMINALMDRLEVYEEGKVLRALLKGAVKRNRLEVYEEGKVLRALLKGAVKRSPLEVYEEGKVLRALLKGAVKRNRIDLLNQLEVLE